MRRILFSSIVSAGFALWVMLYPFADVSRAQTAPAIAPLELWMNWSAGTYVPAEYTGKPVPVPRSVIRVSVEAIRNGRLSSLAGQMVYWYVNDNFVTSGVGVQSYSFAVPAETRDPVEVRVQLPDDPAETATNTVTIPVGRPSATIIAPFPNNVIEGGRTLLLQAVPYFFNASSDRNLLFAWEVDGNTPEASEDPDRLELTVGTVERAVTLPLGVVVRNPSVSGEVGAGTLDLTVVP